MAVSGAFATRGEVSHAIDALLAEEFPSDAISAVTAAGEPIDELSETGMERLNDILGGAGLGALVGGAAGLAAVTLLVPEVGLVLIAGQLVTGGALAGGLIGALLKIGHSREQAESLLEQLQSGRYLILVHSEDTQRAETVLRNAGATHVHVSPAP
jgi:hypothetical protein